LEGWSSEGARIILASDQAARLAELLSEAGRPVGVTNRLLVAPPPGAIALIERSLNGGFGGGPDGLLVITDRELFGSVRVRRPQGPAPVRRATPSRSTRPGRARWKRASRTRRRSTSSGRSRRRRATWSRAGRWIDWSWATLATARRRWRSGPRSRRCRKAREGTHR